MRIGNHKYCNAIFNFKPYILGLIPIGKQGYKFAEESAQYYL